MPRGGRRTGTPGQTYANRSDLNQPVRTAPGQPYGQAGQQAAAQSAIPLPQQAGPPPPAPGLLAAPSGRPGEPVQAGMNMGPGPGSEANVMGSSQDGVLATLEAAYQAHPSDGLLRYITAMQGSSGTT